MEDKYEPYATRRELDQVRDELRILRSDTTTIAVLNQQMAQVTQNMLDFKMLVDHRFDAHDKLHASAEQERTASRRWLIGTAIAAIAAMIGLYGWIALFLPGK